MTLLGLFEEHRAAFEYEWRARFRVPLSSVGGRRMSWGEAFRLTVVLAGDPSTQVAAAMAGWKYPAGLAELVLMDVFDLTYRVAWAQGGGKGSKPKPYPRPWPSRVARVARVDPSLTRDEVVAALRFAGHTGPIPEHLGGD